MLDFLELEKELKEKCREHEEIVEKYQELLVESAYARHKAKKEYAVKYLEIKARGIMEGNKKITEEEAKQKAFLETQELQEEAEVKKALVDAIAERIEQLKYEIEVLRSLLSYYKEVYNLTNVREE